MDLILATDLKGGLIVHGKSGNRESYYPIKTPLSDSPNPSDFVRNISPKFLYIADLNRITGDGSHDSIIKDLTRYTHEIWLDRGSKDYTDILSIPKVFPIYGTETANENYASYNGGYLSIDIKDNHVIPSQKDPVDFLKMVSEFSFSGCILLNITGVGTCCGLNPDYLQMCRDAYSKKLIYGGGVSSTEDLDLLRDAGFDGAIVATAVHNGTIPLQAIKDGIWR